MPTALWFVRGSYGIVQGGAHPSAPMRLVKPASTFAGTTSTGMCHTACPQGLHALHPAHGMEGLAHQGVTDGIRAVLSQPHRRC